MSVQDSIASQNLSEGNAKTALEMIKLQAENMRANQRAGLEVRNQDISREQNQAGNALEQQRIDQTGEQNAFNRYAEERRLGQADRGNARSDYQTYVQGDRALANQEQQTANQAQESANRYDLGLRSNEATLRKQDLNLQKAMMQHGIQQRSLDFQAEELNMAKQLQETKLAKEKLYAEAARTGGTEGLIAALEASGESDKVNAAANMRKTLQAQQEYNSTVSDKARLKHSEDYLGAYNSAKSPEEKGAATAAYIIAAGLPEDTSPELARVAAQNQVVTISKNLGRKFEMNNGALNPVDAQYAAAMFGKKEGSEQPNLPGSPSPKLSSTDQKLMDGFIKDSERARKIESAVNQLDAAYSQLPDSIKGKGVLSKLAQDNPSVVDTASALKGGEGFGGTQLREIAQVAQVLGGLNKFDSQSTEREVNKLINTTPNAGTPEPEVKDWVSKAKAVQARVLSNQAAAEDWVKQKGSLQGYSEESRKWADENPLFSRDGSINEDNISIFGSKNNSDTEEARRLEQENADLRKKLGK